jgi:predicted nucleic acid-binding protein
MMRVAIDTNVLAYAEYVDDRESGDASLSLIHQLRGAGEVIVPAQVLGELFLVLRRKGKRTLPEARAALLKWADACSVIDTAKSTIVDAVELICGHGFNVWDAVILNAAADAQCRLLLSEDMHDGFTWRGTTVVNPYAAKPHALLRPYLEG